MTAVGLIDLWYFPWERPMAAKGFGQWVRPKIAGMARCYNSIN